MRKEEKVSKGMRQVLVVIQYGDDIGGEDVECDDSVMTMLMLSYHNLVRKNCKDAIGGTKD